MKKAFIALISIAVLFTVALFVAAFFYLFERQEITIPARPTGEARHNHYLALEYMLDSFTFETTSYRQFSDMLKHRTNPTAIFWMTDDHALEPAKLSSLPGWVYYDGGNLITVAPQDESDPLLRLFYLDKPENFLPEDAETFTYRYNVTLLDTSASSVLERTIAAADIIIRNNDDELIALSHPYGDGRITFIASPHIFHNRHIGAGDNADLAFLFAAIRIDPNAEGHLERDYEINIIQYGQRVSWMAYVAKIFWPLLAALTAILLLALNHGRKRFGPLQLDRTEHRRSRLEHIHAAGRFLWKSNADHTLLHATREALLHAIARKRPSLIALQDHARYELIAEELDITPAAAKKLFEETLPNRPQAFTESIRTLEQFRRNL